MPNPGAESTRITEALSGSSNGPEATERKPRPAELGTEQANGPNQVAANSTTKHEPVTTPAKPTSEAATKVTPAPEQATQLTAAPDTAESADDKAGKDGDSDEVRAIDATLARFSAVHDEIAQEEAERRGKLSWLFGNRKEPELGTDMPFDFVEGRDSASSRLEWKKSQRKRRTVRIAKIVAVAAALMIFVATGIGWSAKTWINSKFREVSSLDPNSSSIQDIGKQTGDLNFLLVGSDTRAGDNAAGGVGTAKDEPGARADTTMLAHIPADRSRVLVVSFPRDLEVDLPSCERWDPISGEYTGEQLPEKSQVKLNSAYATGGPKCTTKLIQQISGLSVTNFLGIDFHGFKAMVDAVNGVEICTSTPIIDQKLGTVLPKAGTQTISGMQALNYVRARTVYGDPTSDYGRMERQQLFLSALLRKTMSSEVLLNPGKLSDFVNAVSANTFGENVSTDQLIELGQSMRGMEAGKVTFITVPTTGYANEAGNEELLKEETEELFRGIIEGAPIKPPSSSGAGSPRAASSPSSSTSGPAMSSSAMSSPAMSSSGGPSLALPIQTVGPVTVPVRVLNGTQEVGLAGRTGEKLDEEGFAMAGIGALDQPSQRTFIKYAPANAAAAKVLAKSLPGAELVEDPAAGGELVVELGANYDGRVLPGPAEIPDNLSTVNAGKDTCG